MRYRETNFLVSEHELLSTCLPGLVTASLAGVAVGLFGVFRGVLAVVRRVRVGEVKPS